MRIEGRPMAIDTMASAGSIRSAFQHLQLGNLFREVICRI